MTALVPELTPLAEHVSVKLEAQPMTIPPATPEQRAYLEKLIDATTNYNPDAVIGGPRKSRPLSPDGDGATMSEMAKLERVARALYESDYPEHSEAIEGIWEIRAGEYRKAARAAIEAMPAPAVDIIADLGAED